MITVDQSPASTYDPQHDAAWWRQAVVYQIYPRSFADSNGDGLGDIPGITSRIDHLAELGIDAVWLSPFYPSELADGGYDVADYRNVDPRLGTLRDFDDLVKTLHNRGIRVIVDIVPNHTSDQHEWFQEALQAGRGSEARDRYIFREGTGPDGAEPPSDWRSIFGGSAWERVDDGQWYLHHFAVEQPDLNWDNREVRDDFVSTLRFWSDRGVDGFRIDVAHMLTKDLTEPLPTHAELQSIPQDGHHPTLDRDDVHHVYAEWRAVFNSYEPPRTAVAEAWVDRERVPLYASPESLGQAFNFELLQADFDPEQFRRIVTDNLDLAARSGSSSTWVLSNHDVTRHATRYGLPRPTRDDDGHSTVKHGTEWVLAGGPAEMIDLAGGARRARAATLFLLGLPGSAYLYQGEELGLQEVADIPDNARQDPTFFRGGGTDGLGRDGCRVPLPWKESGESFGFGSAGAHLPQPAWFAGYAVAREEKDPTSSLTMYRRALALRRSLQSSERLEWIETGDPEVLRFRRPNGWEVVTNFGAGEYPLDRADIVISSGPVRLGEVAGETTVWLAPPEE
ncbi:glycoside hydrolase family 13 protein [Micromonospora sp. DT81.3]|uniref:glycoside hydrolase family 13 protein n=1 Tax=Micromonospora sp. DT81.3 TaxID=3416523 RepID=UPI003CFA6DD3